MKNKNTLNTNTLSIDDIIQYNQYNINTYLKLKVYNINNNNILNNKEKNYFINTLLYSLFTPN
jgi:hypothetical protein